MNEKSKLKLIFLGTPDFAVASLDALLKANMNVVGVVTAPDKPAGRGLKISESAVKKFAAEKGLHILQPEKLKSPEFLDQLKSLNADLQVVVAFRMLPEVVWNMPRLGTINLHASLLPSYRGAAPINWAVMNGEKETGVTTFKLQHAIDTGNILMQEKIAIGDEETAGELHDRMMKIGADLLVKTVQGLEAGTLKEIPQSYISEEILPHGPKIFTETARIDWSKSVNEIYNLIRGLSPYPGAFTDFNGKMMKIFRASKENSSPTIAPGEFDTDKKSFLKFAAKDGYINVLELQLEGKKKMPITDFIRGMK